MPKTVDHLALMDTSACSGSNGGPENPGAVGATPLDSWEEVKENLKAFTDSVHAKAAQVVSWIQAAEPLQTEGSIRLLDLKLAPKKIQKTWWIPAGYHWSWQIIATSAEDTPNSRFVLESLQKKL